MLGFGLAIEPKLWALIFVMVRVGAAFILAPVFGAVAIPLPVRVGLTGAVGIFVLAVHPVAPPAQVFAVATFLSVFSEALVGAAIGFILQIAFAAPMVASEIIGGSMGIGFASSIDPQNGRSSPALGQFFTIMLTLLFLSVDGHLVLVQLLVKSYETMPPGSWISTDRLKDIAFFGGYAFLAGCCWRCRSASCCCASTSSSAWSAARRRRSTCSRSACPPACGRRRRARRRLPGDGRLHAGHHPRRPRRHRYAGERLMSGGGDKTEAPTQRRKEKAAEDGNILKSKDFATALVVMAGVAWLIFAGPSLIAACKAVMTASFQFDRTDVEDFSPWRPLQQAGWKLLPSLITLFAVSVIATIISSAGLGSLTWNNKLIAFKGERITPRRA